jgi:hypothetical protein
VILLGDNVGSTKKKTENLIDASKEVGLEVNTEKGRAITQAVSRWPPTAAARVQTRI